MLVQSKNVLKINSVDAESLNDTYLYKIKEITQLNDSIYKIYFIPTFNFFKHSVGQYCEILCPDGKYRPFSIVNCPNIDNGIELHIRITHKNLFMKDLLKFECAVNIRGPYGNYDNTLLDKRHVILIAEGIGIAGFYSILNNNFNPLSCHLLWLRNSFDSQYSNNDIQYWHSKINNFNSSIFKISEKGQNQLLKYCNKLLLKYSYLTIYYIGSPSIKNFIDINLVKLTTNIDFLYDF